MLEISNIYAGYYKGKEILKNISLNIGDKSVTALMGRNGVGKTTLCRCIIGEVVPFSGRILIGGKSTTGLAVHEVIREGVSYVPQGRGVFNSLTVEENIKLALFGSKNLGSIDIAWSTFPLLYEFRKKKGGFLSGGEQKMLSIARALVSVPKLIILDEPSDALQPSSVTLLSEILSSVVKEFGFSILLVEQNLEVVRNIASSCTFLDDGQITKEISINKITSYLPEIREFLAF